MLNRNLLVFVVSLFFAAAKACVAVFWLYGSITRPPVRAPLTQYSIYWPRICPVLSATTLTLNAILIYLTIRGIDHAVPYLLVTSHAVLIVTLVRALCYLTKATLSSLRPDICGTLVINMVIICLSH